MNDLITKDISDNYTRPISNKKNKEILALTVKEQKIFVKIIKNSKYYIQYLIALNTGMRMGEINALHIKDINFTEKTIRVNKTISRGFNYKDYINDTTKIKVRKRIIPINSILFDELYFFCRNKKGYLFSQEKILSVSTVNSEFKRLNKKIY